MKAILERIKNRYSRKIELIRLVEDIDRRIEERLATIRRELSRDRSVDRERLETSTLHQEQLERMFLRAKGFCPIVNILDTEKAILKIELSRHTWHYILTGRDD